MQRARRVVAFTAAAVFASVAAMTTAVAAKVGDVVAATVSPGSQLSSQGHYYLLNGKPGDSITQSVRVSNPNDHAVTVNIDAVDAVTGELTGVQLGRPGSPRALTSRWIVISSPQITLDPDEARDVPFTVHVPAGATPGQYLAAVSASVPLSAADATANQVPAGKAGFSLAVRFQRAIAVEIDVPGPRSPNLVVNGAAPQATASGVQLDVRMANTGNAFARGSGVIRVPDTNTDYSFRVDTFVPGTAIVYPMPWTKAVVPGSHHVEVDLAYQDGRRTSWSGTVVIAGDAQNRLESQLRNVAVGHRSSRAPLFLILAIALFVALVAAAIVLRRRRRVIPPVNYRAL